MEYELYHHGILGQKWGKRNGPPYPLSGSDYSAAERKLNKIKKKYDKKIDRNYDSLKRKEEKAAQRLERRKLTGSARAMRYSIKQLDVERQTKHKQVAKLKTLHDVKKSRINRAKDWLYGIDYDPTENNRYSSIDSLNRKSLSFNMRYYANMKYINSKLAKKNAKLGYEYLKNLGLHISKSNSDSSQHQQWQHQQWQQQQQFYNSNMW